MAPPSLRWWRIDCEPSLMRIAAVSFHSRSPRCGQRYVRLVAAGHGDRIDRIELHWHIGFKEVCGDIVTRGERRRRGPCFSKRYNLAKFVPDRGRAGTEIAIRLLQPANIHPECGVEQILSQDISGNV